MKNKNLIPTSFQCGGITYEVKHVDKCTDFDYGNVQYSPSIIEIADKTRIGDAQSESCKTNTFFHELVHTILNTMREDDLQNDRFVSTFASFLTEAMVTAEYKEEQQ